MRPLVNVLGSPENGCFRGFFYLLGSLAVYDGGADASSNLLLLTSSWGDLGSAAAWAC